MLDKGVKATGEEQVLGRNLLFLVSTLLVWTAILPLIFYASCIEILVCLDKGGLN